VPGEGGTELRAYCRQVLDAGPGPLTQDALDLVRYFLTDLLDDLRGGGDAEAMAAVAVEVWREAAELLLGVHARWSGTGKWLVRELAALDLQQHTTYVTDFHQALQRALAGDTALLLARAEKALDLAGGPLWEGFRLAAKPPSQGT
jgi:hypothetical protein